MTRLHASSRAATTALLGSALLAMAPVLAGDRIPPTQPRNLTVTGVEPYAVSLRWTPSTDNSGQVSYVICCANGSDEEVPGSVSNHTFRSGLEANRPFSLRIYAFDAAGNFSKSSNPVSGVTSADTLPPAQPVVTVDQVGSTYAMLRWQSQDNGPHIWYTVSRDGQPFIRASSQTSGIATLLDPRTTYDFTVQAGDFAGNASPPSAPLAVTTTPVNPADRSPPTVPGNLHASLFGGDDGEIWITWDQSVDDFDPQAVIRYDIRINGVLDGVLVGTGQQVTYLTQPGTNTIVVTAQDSAGNVSAPASVTVPF